MHCSFEINRNLDFTVRIFRAACTPDQSIRDPGTQQAREVDGASSYRSPQFSYMFRPIRHSAAEAINKTKKKAVLFAHQETVKQGIQFSALN